MKIFKFINKFRIVCVYVFCEKTDQYVNQYQIQSFKNLTHLSKF